jgi:catalase
MDGEARARLIGNIVEAMKPTPRFIQERQIAHLHKADPEFGRGVAVGLGLDADEIMKRAV